jgi:hypothetical protein
MPAISPLWVLSASLLVASESFKFDNRVSELTKTIRDYDMLQIVNIGGKYDGRI